MVKEITRPGRKDILREQIDEMLDDRHDQKAEGESGLDDFGNIPGNVQRGHSGFQQTDNRTQRNPKNG